MLRSLIAVACLTVLICCSSQQEGPPEANRFTKIVLSQKLNEPLELVLLPGDRVLYIERKGRIRLYDPATEQTKTVANIAVSTKYTDGNGNVSEAEDGLLGIVLDPGFATNSWIYLYYSHPAEVKNILSRFEFRNDTILFSSEKRLLEIPTQREQCCHTGGSMVFDNRGNLYLSTGDNTNSRGTTYAPIDNRDGRNPWDAQKSSANTNDLRGKVIRIHPEDDGTYSVPDGNLFPGGTDKTRPEIYTMGTRNPYRISFDNRSGYLYWGDVGPDAAKDSTGRGPRSYDEINQAREAGFFGWPYFVADNKAYNQRDFVTGTTGNLYDPLHPVNRSPNNTGLEELPPAQKAFIWYPYDSSAQFPLVGTGGRSAMAGDVFYSNDFSKAIRPFPDYYDGKLFIYEWMRGWIMTVTMDDDGNYQSMERFLPDMKFNNPMDMAFSRETGDLFVLEYGTGWFQGNDDSRLVRIEFNKGNRKPSVKISADKLRSAVPFKAAFSSEGTTDADHDQLWYEWSVTRSNGAEHASSSEASPSFTFEEPGVYKVELKVTDKAGESSTETTEVIAGNEPPRLDLIIEGNQSFFFENTPFTYEVKLTDKEDGSLEAGTIAPEQVSFSIDYLPEGFDKAEIAQGHVQSDVAVGLLKGKMLLESGDCRSCHAIDETSVGPKYNDVAARYRNDPNAVTRLAQKVIDGGSGVWGKVNMSAHPQLSKDDAVEMIKYILGLGQPSKEKVLPVKGTYTPRIAKGVPNTGVYIVRSSYTDRGAEGAGSATAERSVFLRSASVPAGTADGKNGVTQFKLAEPPVDLMIFGGAEASVSFNKIDLTGIAQIDVVTATPKQGLAAAGGRIEVHIDSQDGQMIGETQPIPVQEAGGFTQMQPQVSVIPLTPTTGAHDIYFVGKSADPGAQSMFILLNIQFIPSTKNNP